MMPMMFTFPQPLSRMVEHMPTWPPSFILTRVLNLVLGKLINHGDLRELYGKQFAINVTDIGLHFYFTLQKEGFLATNGNRIMDLTISAHAHEFYLLAMRKEDPDTLFFNRRLIVEGDTELGLVVKNTLDSIEHPMIKLKRLAPPSPYLLARIKARLWS